MTKNQELTLVLLRAGLGTQKADPALFKGLSPQDWNEINRTAHLQGVGALVWDGIRQSPTEIVPPKELIYKWAIFSEKIKKHYQLHQHTIARLAKNVASEGIRMLIVKGVSLARLYPMPEHREAGDVDCHFFGAEERVEEIMKADGGLIERMPRSHHDICRYRGVLFEVHHCFVPPVYEIEKFIGDRLNKLLTLPQQEYSFDGVTIYFPNREFECLFTFFHAAKHLVGEGIVWRHLCDLAVLMREHQPDLCRMRALFATRGMRHLFDTLCHLTVDLMGAPSELVADLSRHPKLEQRISAEILQGHLFLFRKHRIGVGKFVYRIRNLIRREWKQRLAYDRSSIPDLPHKLWRFITHPLYYFR